MQNQKAKFMTPPKIELENLENVFFELCSNKMNLEERKSYIQKNKKDEDFIPLEKIKQSLSFLKNKKLNSIYLSGFEPLLHPDFNQILRMCLKISNTTIITKGTMINDKKARFLRKIDDESEFETIYRISLDSINEYEDDKLHSRGHFRKALSALENLIKYEFNPIVSMVNYKNRCHEEIFEEYRNFFQKLGIEFEKINLKIVPNFEENLEQLNSNVHFDKTKLDCYNSRVVSKTGLYSCLMLVNDFRARLGNSLEDFSKTNYLDCEKCNVCIKSNSKAQVNDWM